MRRRLGQPGTAGAGMVRQQAWLEAWNLGARCLPAVDRVGRVACGLLPMALRRASG